jgi:hypothetical protein
MSIIRHFTSGDFRISESPQPDTIAVSIRASDGHSLTTTISREDWERIASITTGYRGEFTWVINSEQ